jgi:hypothetical protein
VKKTTLRAWLPLLVLLLCTGSARAQGQSLPLDQSPARVVVGVFLEKLDKVDENGGKIEATFQIQFRWDDTRLAFKSPLINDSHHFVGAKVKPQLDKMWVPKVDVGNLVDPKSLDDAVLHQELAIGSDGSVTWTRRLHAQLSEDLELSSFPMDRQKFRINFNCPEDSLEKIEMKTDQESLEFSASPEREMTGWVLYRTYLEPGWETRRDGITYAELNVIVPAQRLYSSYILTIFIPVLAVTLIPVLAFSLNRSEEGRFAIETIDLISVNLGGLFATVALTYTIYSAYPFLTVRHNLVASLFTLNYVLLASTVGLMLALLKPHTGDTEGWLSRTTVHTLYDYLCWALPAFTMAAIATLFIYAIA